MATERDPTMPRAEITDGVARFAILGTQRTGTTFIRTSLGNHPEILCHGEVFNLGKKAYRDEGGYWHYVRQGLPKRMLSILRPAQSTDLYLRSMYSTREYSAIGFKLMLSHCRARSHIWPVVKKWNIKVLLVQRRNSLKTLVSREAASNSGVYHVSESLRRGSSVSSWTPRKVILDLPSLVQKLDSIAAEHTEWKRLIGDLPTLEVVYEDYIDDTTAGNSAILNFLGLPLAPLSSDLKKVNPDNLREVIGNYEDVAATLRGTRYESQLEPTG
jgi:hypothetical protein